MSGRLISDLYSEDLAWSYGSLENGWVAGWQAGGGGGGGTGG